MPPVIEGLMIGLTGGAKPGTNDGVTLGFIDGVRVGTSGGVRLGATEDGGMRPGLVEGVRPAPGVRPGLIVEPGEVANGLTVACANAGALKSAIEPRIATRKLNNSICASKTIGCSHDVGGRSCVIGPDGHARPLDHDASERAACRFCNTITVLFFVRCPLRTS